MALSAVPSPAEKVSPVVRLSVNAETDDSVTVRVALSASATLKPAMVLLVESSTDDRRIGEAEIACRQRRRRDIGQGQNVAAAEIEHRVGPGLGRMRHHVCKAGDVGESAEIEGVAFGAVEVGDSVGAEAAAIDEPVGARAASQRVVTGIARQHVVAGPAGNIVRVNAAVILVAAVVAIDRDAFGAWIEKLTVNGRRAVVAHHGGILGIGNEKAAVGLGRDRWRKVGLRPEIRLIAGLAAI